ncbi:NAD(P)H-binding protein [Mesorhizobium sp.]|jgi:NAD(P)H dehydrogenase (quinone)|uniref:NAD(P)H-binding protein n=1 Tax=Mesorhizobium sp. TaxID=1871066 RepID=UPI0035661F9A
MYVITGATGQLGRLALKELLKSVPPSEIIAAVRDPRSALDLAAEGVQVRLADYDRPETLSAAFDGAERLLLISSNLTTGRVRQHQAVIDAAKIAGVKLIAYTSMLQADRSGAKLAREHLATELALAASGVPTTVLRNGWYTENYLMALQPALSGGTLYGSAGEGRISLAARADYAAAAAAALTSADGPRTYELAGDTGWTLSELAQEISRQADRSLGYVDLPEKDYETALIAAGLPSDLAELLADADANAARGALFDDGHVLRHLIGRPTTPVAQSISAALHGSRS